MGWLDTVERSVKIFKDGEGLVKEWDKMFDDLFRGYSYGFGTKTTTKLRKSDDAHIEQGDGKVTIYIAVPGCTAEDVTLSLDDDDLVIKAQAERPGGRQWSLVRKVKFPEEGDPDNIEATVKDGMLTVVLNHLPDEPKSMSFKIEVKAG